MCESKKHGGRRCRNAATRNRNERRGITKALVVGEGLSEEQAHAFYYAVKSWSQRTYGSTQIATAEAVNSLKTRLKEALTMNPNLNTRDKNTIFRRAEASLGEHPTVDRVTLWSRLVEALKRARLIGVVGAVLVTQAACGGGGGAQEPVTVPTAPEQTQSQSAEPVESEAPVETETPAPEVVENTTSFTVDPASVEIPQDVLEAYGPEATANLASDALSVASLANEAKELHAARSGEELNSWGVYKEFMSPEAYQRLQDNVAASVAGDADATERLDSLQPMVQRDGTIAEIDGVTYSAGDRGIAVDIIDTPTVRLDQDPTAGLRVAVDLPQQATAYTQDGKTLAFTMTKTLVFTPGADGHWLLDGYAAGNVSPIVVGSA